MTDYSDPWWGHISGKCIDDCPWCHINELQAELAELREALAKYGEHHAYCETAIHKPCDCGLRAALLQEKGE